MLSLFRRSVHPFRFFISFIPTWLLNCLWCFDFSSNISTAFIIYISTDISTAFPLSLFKWQFSCFHLPQFNCFPCKRTSWQFNCFHLLLFRWQFNCFQCSNLKLKMSAMTLQLISTAFGSSLQKTLQMIWVLQLRLQPPSNISDAVNILRDFNLFTMCAFAFFTFTFFRWTVHW